MSQQAQLLALVDRNDKDKSTHDGSVCLRQEGRIFMLYQDPAAVQTTRKAAFHT